MDLPRKQQRIEGKSEVVDNRIADDGGYARIGIDLDLAGVSAVWIGRVRRRERLGRAQFRRGRARKRRDLRIRDRAVGSGDAHLAVRDFEIGDRRLQLVGRQFLQRARQGFRSAGDHHRADGNGSRSARAEASRDPIGVALHDLDALKRHVEKLRDGLGVGGLMSLPVRLGADGEREIAVLLKRQRAGSRNRSRRCIRYSSQCRSPGSCRAPERRPRAAVKPA